MGFAASQARLLMLTARRSDLERDLQFINQARTQLANMVSLLIQRGMNLDPESADANRLQQATAAIQQEDKRFELEANRINTQHEAVSTEVEAVRKVISKNIASSFKLMG